MGSRRPASAPGVPFPTFRVPVWSPCVHRPFREVFPDMKTTYALLLVLILLPGSLLAQSASSVSYVPDRIVITVREGLTLSPLKVSGPAQVGVPALDDLAQQFDVTSVTSLYGNTLAKLPAKAKTGVLERVFAVDFPAGLDLHRIKAAYENLPEVEEVRLVDFVRPCAFLPDDPDLVSQWHLRNMNVGGGDVRAVGGWNQTLADSNIVVAIIDSGMDWHHPDLGGPHPDKVNGAVWTNWTEYYGTPGVDDDNNGYIDDIRGWDFVDSPQSAGYPDEDMGPADNDPSDYESHGTACAGCVAAITNNGIGVAGVAPGCKLMALRAGYLPAGETGGVLRSDWISQAMMYAAANGASIINCSWSSPTAFLLNAVTVCQNADILIVSSAGNEDTSDPSNHWLGTAAGVVAVAATNPDDAKASFSNYGTWVEVSAPGTNIRTTWYEASLDLSTYASVNGTSFSCPITVGVAAMIRSANPSLDYLEVIDLLMASCDNIDDENPLYVGLLGAGRVNVLKALGDNMHRYPQEFPTLFDATNSSADTDTVGIEGGTIIPGPFMIPDGGMKIFGGYSADYLSRDPFGNPAVVASTANDEGMRFLAGVDTNTEVDGFLIHSGGGTIISSIPYNGRFGGGVIINSVSPTLRNMTITGNSVGNAVTLGGGGGILVNNGSPVFENLTITGNTAIYGGGIYMNNSSVTMINCTISDNTLLTDNMTYNPLGGGIFGIDSDLDMTDCTVSGHTGCESGGGIYLGTDSGTSNLTMRGCEVSGNDANVKGAGIYHSSGILDLKGVLLDQNVMGIAPNFMSGGGLYAADCAATADSLVCTGNTSQLGSAVTFENCSSADLTNSLLQGNAADFYGALVLQGLTASTVSGNTIAVNSAPAAGAGGIYVAASTVSLDHNIVALNTGGTVYALGVHVMSGTVTPSCNDVWNSGSDWGGMDDPTGLDGNISADPEFCDVAGGKFDIKTTSPCDPDNNVGCGLIGALGDGCDIVSNVDLPDETQVPTVFRVDQNVPNPFNPLTKIRFNLPYDGYTEVAIFDIKGRRVSTLVSDHLKADRHEVEWAGRDDRGRAVAAGVYFYMVSSGEHRAVGRMALVK